MWWSRKKKPASNPETPDNGEMPAKPVDREVKFKAAGQNNQLSQANMILARNSPAFPAVKGLFQDALAKRSQTVMLDYTRDNVGMRYEVDGIWHNIGAHDRPTGDAMLVVMKKLADLDVKERKLRQQGTFKIEYMGDKLECTLVSQGVKTGERVVLKLSGKGGDLDTLEQLGMREQMIEQVKGILNGEDGAMFIVSARPGDGLTTSWCAVLRAADRYMRDFVGVEADNNCNPEVENVNIETFSPAAGESPDTVLKSLLLKQPEALIVPEFVNGTTVDMLSDEVVDGKLVVSSVKAKDPFEALLRILALKPSRDKFAKAITAVLFQRLVRRLCETCRQAYQPAPQMLQKLGVPAGKAVTFFRQYQPPPPEQCVDEKGNPVQPPICPDCGGMGFRGRAAVFELLMVNDQMREALTKQPTMELLKKIARAAKHRTVQEEGIGAVARGLTALNELQRVMKQ